MTLTKKDVIVTLDEKVVQEIPLEAYERFYWEYEPGKPLEKEIEYIDYVNEWGYKVTDSGVVLCLDIRLGGENLSFGVYPQDENNRSIKTNFSVGLKDGEFTLEYVQD